jgi:hypothetical protein
LYHIPLLERDAIEVFVSWLEDDDVNPVVVQMASGRTQNCFAYRPQQEGDGIGVGNWVVAQVL